MGPLPVVNRTPFLRLPNDVPGEGTPTAKAQELIHCITRDERSSGPRADLLHGGLPNFVCMGRQTSVRFELVDEVLGIWSEDAGIGTQIVTRVCGHYREEDVGQGQFAA